VSDSAWRFECGDGPNGMLGIGPVDVTLTDSPFSKRVDDNHAAETVRDRGNFDFEPMTPELLDRSARTIASVTRRWAIVITDYEEGVPAWKNALVQAGMVFWCTGHYRKINPAPLFKGKGPSQGNEAIVICHGAYLEQYWNGGGKRAEWSATVVPEEQRLHPTQKPLMLLRQLIEDFTDPGELIADPFAGVATTGVAAIGSGRRFWGAEKDQRYHALGLGNLSSPLFDNRPLQADLIATTTKGHAKRVRYQLDKTVLDFVRSSNGVGVNLSMLAAAMPDASEKDLQRALARLVQNKAVRRTGKTSTTRYHARLPQEPDHGCQETQ